MSKISLKPNASGTGVFSLEAPNSNSDRTLNLPDEAGTVLTNVSDIESQVKTATNATGSAPVYACRAWVNFDGTGTVSIRDSGNVSSVTDNGTGNYRVNFSTAMPDNNYAVVVTGTTLNFGNARYAFLNFTSGGAQDAVQANSYVEIFSGTPHVIGTAQNRLDTEIITLSVFR